MLSLKLTICVLVCLVLHVRVYCKKPDTFLRYRDYNNYKGYDVKGSEEALEDLKNDFQENLETVTYMSYNKSTQVVIAPELDDLFQAYASQLNLERTLIFDDLSELIELEKGVLLRSEKEFSWDAYYDVDDINKYLKSMSKIYPKWVKEIVGGRTYEGRLIRGLQINTSRQEKKPVFFIESGIHAREWIAPATTTYFINQLLTSSDPNVTRLRDQFDWHIFPTVNPDGYHYSYTVDRLWRKTRSNPSLGDCAGVDPNRNWNYDWGQSSSSHDHCSSIYCGPRAFSEVETRTLSSYISKLQNMLFYVAFHSDAGVLLLPLSDSKKHVENYDDLVRIGKVSLDYGYRVNKVRYDSIGTAAETLYPASGGSMDWVRNTLNTSLVYTYELRGASFSWPASRIPEQGDEVTQMMLGLATEAKNLNYF